MRPVTPSEAAFNARMSALSHQETPTQPCPDASPADTLLAEQALESTRLAIARWTGGIHLPQMLVPGMVRVSPQARWYAQVNNGFQEWVNQGGFKQSADTSSAHHTLAPRPALRNADDENSDTCVD